LLWWLDEDQRLPSRWQNEIESAETAWVSTASVWELSIKQQSGKLRLPDDFRDQLVQDQFSILPVHLDHALQCRNLPPHHRDPFDRMLIAQAQVEDLIMISADPKFRQYEVELLATG